MPIPMRIKGINRGEFKLFPIDIDINNIDVATAANSIVSSGLKPENIEEFMGRFEGETEWKWFFHLRQDGIELLTDGERVWEKT